MKEPLKRGRTVQAAFNKERTAALDALIKETGDTMGGIICKAFDAYVAAHKRRKANKAVKA